MSSNENLHKANINKNDEFYTQLGDIEKEVYKYKEQLKNKVVYCNCDDPAWSNFVRHFIMQFNYYELKGLIATGYIKGAGALSVDLFTTGGTLKTSYCLKINKVDKELEQYIIDNANKTMTNTDLFNLLKQKGFITELKEDGDFRSQECIWLLHQSDVVITNPPFSLFREYISQLMSFDKKFLIMGNMNAVTYKDVFKHIKENKLWLGYNNNKTCEFGLSKYYEKYTRIENEMKFGKVPSISWFTNLQTTKQLEKLILYKKYYKTEEDKNNPNYTNPEYPKYDNYNAIEVSRVADIPIDYEGVMGVPITFLDKYNPKQFEIEKFRKGDDDKDLVYTKKEYLRHGKDADIEREREEFNHTSEYSFVIVGTMYEFDSPECHIRGTEWTGKIKGRYVFKRILIKRV